MIWAILHNTKQQSYCYIATSMHLQEHYIAL